MFYVYILRRSNNTYYIGQTRDIESRLRRHQNGQVRTTKGHLPIKLVYDEAYGSRSEAMRREKELKSWKSHAGLEELISNAP